MPDRKRKTVYILGSGFSVGVGGPQLSGLLSDRGRAEMLARFPALMPCTEVYDVFWGHQRENVKSQGRVLWSHAEEFLEYVNTQAWTTNSGTKVLRDIVKGLSPNKDRDLAGFARLATFAIAAECSFAEQANPNRESWEPYVSWASKLRNPDTILTFNYDRVLETINEPGQKANVPNLNPESVVLPWEPDRQRDTNLVRIFKLHGSVDWFFKESSPHSIGQSLQTAFEDDFTPLMGVPGPSKREHVSKHFDKLWTLALAEIEDADVIVFLGYRFPPSDSYARTALLTAIGKNKHRYLRIHTVLGPDTRHEHTVRLTKLLELTLENAGRGTNALGPRTRPPAAYRGRYYDLLAQPLYVEDFLTVIHDNELYGATLVSQATDIRAPGEPSPEPEADG